MTFKAFTEEQWNALRAVRDDWPETIDWKRFRWEFEGQGGVYWMQHEGKEKFEKPSAIRKRLKAVEGQLRKMRAEMKSLPDHVTHSAPDLAPIEQWLQDWLFICEGLEEPFASGFAGRSDYYRDMLCEWLLIQWVNTLGGELSYSRRLGACPSNRIFLDEAQAS